MKAVDKEIKCITVSQSYYTESANRAIEKFKHKHFPIILTPSAFQRRFIPDFKAIFDSNTFVKKILFILPLTIFYVLLFPVSFFYALYEYVSGKRLKMNKGILVIKDLSKLDLNVSPDKLFIQLWNDKGLVDKGEGHYAITFNSEEKSKCIEEWFKILYGNIIQLDNIKTLIQNRQFEGARKFHEQHPGGHINLRKIVDILPEEIDYQMPNYA